VRPAYCRALSQYQKVITQRSALLRRIRDGEESPHALAYWDGEMARLAAPIMRERATFLERAEVAAARVYASLARDEAGDDHDTGSSEAPALRVAYRPSYKGSLAGDESDVVAGILAQLAELRRREIAQGVNVLGPHRDDVAFLAETPGGLVDLAAYGSRGQQRSVALAVKLAELEYIETMTGDQPILLLDDVLSELDAQRRGDLLLAVQNVEQVLLTTTDTERVPPEILAGARIYEVRTGQIAEAR